MLELLYIAGVNRGAAPVFNRLAFSLRLTSKLVRQNSRIWNYSVLMLFLTHVMRIQRDACLHY